MKKYKEYMEGVTASDTLHEKLLHLEKPRKKPQAWKKYGAAAAALALVIGLGGWGISLRDSDELGKTAEGNESVPAVGEIYTEPDIAPEPTGAVPVPMPNSPGMEMMGGYEVDHGETVAYYFLPRIQYGAAEELKSADTCPPVGVFRRDLTPEEIEALLGGEINLEAHLRWSDYTVYAHAMLNRDGSLWLLCITGIKSDTERFTLEVMPGALPPGCLVYDAGEAQVNNIWEREVTALCHEGAFGSTHLVSFMDGGFGYRFQLNNGDPELVNRLVRWIIVGDGLTFEKREGAPAGNSEEMSTPAYDPAAPAPTATPNTAPN